MRLVAGQGRQDRESVCQRGRVMKQIIKTNQNPHPVSLAQDLLSSQDWTFYVNYLFPSAGWTELASCVIII